MARCKGVFPASSTTLLLEVQFSTNSLSTYSNPLIGVSQCNAHTSKERCSTEVWIAVFPTLFFLSGLAPHLSKILAQPGKSLSAQMCKGVFPFISVTSGLIHPLPASSDTTSCNNSLIELASEQVYVIPRCYSGPLSGVR